MVNSLQNVSQNLEIDQSLYQTGELNSVGEDFCSFKEACICNCETVEY